VTKPYRLKPFSGRGLAPYLLMFVALLS